MLQDAPVYAPSMEEFEDFAKFMATVEEQCKDYGCCSIIPPQGWRAREESYDNADDFVIPKPIRQYVVGRKGIYHQYNVESKSMTVKDFKQQEEEWQRKLLEPAPGALEPNYAEIERRFWKTISMAPPLYGADVPGSLFADVPREEKRGRKKKNNPNGNSNDDKPRRPRAWDLSNLDTILKLIDVHIPGVNSPYLYFGMWKSVFACHTEDMDLYSVNYLHYGYPKIWYVIPPDHASRFEALAREEFNDLYKSCNQFLRHKMTLFEPSVLIKRGIKVMRVVQRAGQFVITFPRAYHWGFNTGINCAEATNFATERWISYGLNAKPCQCVADSVRIDMNRFLSAYEDWKKMGRKRLAAETMPLNPTKQKKESKKNPKQSKDVLQQQTVQGVSSLPPPSQLQGEGTDEKPKKKRGRKPKAQTEGQSPTKPKAPKKSKKSQADGPSTGDMMGMNNFGGEYEDEEVLVEGKPEELAAHRAQNMGFNPAMGSHFTLPNQQQQQYVHPTTLQLQQQQQQLMQHHQMHPHQQFQLPQIPMQHQMHIPQYLHQTQQPTQPHQAYLQQQPQAHQLHPSQLRLHPNQQLPPEFAMQFHLQQQQHQQQLQQQQQQQQQQQAQQAQQQQQQQAQQQSQQSQQSPRPTQASKQSPAAKKSTAPSATTPTKTPKVKQEKKPEPKKVPKGKGRKKRERGYIPSFYSPEWEEWITTHKQMWREQREARRQRKGLADSFATLKKKQKKEEAPKEEKPSKEKKKPAAFTPVKQQTQAPSPPTVAITTPLPPAAQVKPQPNSKIQPQSVLLNSGFPSNEPMGPPKTPAITIAKKDPNGSWPLPTNYRFHPIVTQPQIPRVSTSPFSRIDSPLRILTISPTESYLNSGIPPAQFHNQPSTSPLSLSISPSPIGNWAQHYTNGSGFTNYFTLSPPSPSPTNTSSAPASSTAQSLSSSPMSTQPASFNFTSPLISNNPSPTFPSLSLGSSAPGAAIPSLSSWRLSPPPVPHYGHSDCQSTDCSCSFGNPSQHSGQGLPSLMDFPPNLYSDQFYANAFPVKSALEQQAQQQQQQSAQQKASNLQQLHSAMNQQAQQQQHQSAQRHLPQLFQQLPPVPSSTLNGNSGGNNSNNNSSNSSLFF